MVLTEKKLIPILQKLVQIKTENPKGQTKEIVDYLNLQFHEKDGFRKKIISYKKDGIELHNFVVNLGNGSKKIVLCGHLDTVPVNDIKSWEYDPFSAKIIAKKVFGRGTSDMKGGLTSLIGVMFYFKDKKKFLENYTLSFVATADEEAGMSGAEFLNKQGIMENAILLIIPEATNQQIGIAEKGVLWIKLTILGKAAHGSMPEEGINAIEGAAALIPQIHACIEPKKSELLGKSTVNLGIFNGGNKINVVPNKVTMEVDIRLVLEESPEEVLNKLKSMNSSQCSYDLEIIQNLPPLISDSKYKFIQNLKSITRTKLIGLTYGTDAAKLLEKQKIPFVIFGPGDSKIIHQSNEFVPINQVIQVATQICEAIEKSYL